MDLRRQMQERNLASGGPGAGKGPADDRIRRMFGDRGAQIMNKKKTPAQRLLGQDRKYFDSGDWVLSKAGKADPLETGSVGSEHPVPEKIPHLSSPVGGVQQHHHIPSVHGGQASSPVKDSSFLCQETKAEEVRTPLNEDPNQPQRQQAGGQQQRDGSGNGNLPIRS